MGRFVLSLALILSILTVARSSPARADDDPCEGVLVAIKGTAFAFAGDDADAGAAIAAVTTIEAARAKLVPISDGAGGYGATAQAAATNAIRQIDECLKERNQAKPADGGAAAPPAAGGPAAAPNAQPAAGGTTGQNPPSGDTNRLAGPAPIAPLSDQRPADATAQPGSLPPGAVLGTDPTVRLFRQDAPVASTAPGGARGVSLLDGRGAAGGAAPGVTYRATTGEPFRPLEPGTTVASGATVGLGAGATAALQIGETPVEAQAGKDGQTLRPSAEADVPASTFSQRGRAAIDVPVPGLEVEGGGSLTVWQAVSGVFSGLWLTVTAPVRAGVDAALDVLLYLRASGDDTTGALQGKIRVEPGSQMLILPGERGNEFYVRGKVEVTLAPPQSSPPTFLDARVNYALGLPPRAHTPNADAEPQHTAFTIEYVEDAGRERTLVTVTEGSVLLRDVDTAEERLLVVGETGTVESAAAAPSPTAGAATAAPAAAAATTMPAATPAVGTAAGSEDASGGGTTTVAIAVVVLAVIAGGAWFALRRRASASRS